MRIGLSTSAMQRGRSGVGQYVLALVRALLGEAGRHDFTLFVLEEDLPLFAFAATAMKLVPVAERYRPPVRNVLWHQLHLPKLVRQLRLDVLHVPSYRRLLWSHPCALVATIHDLAPFRFPRKYSPARMLYGRVIVPRLARRQDELIAVSRFTAADIDTFFGLPHRRVRVIHNGLDHERFHPGSQAAAKASVALSHGLRQPFFLYVARLEHPAKNHARLIAAFNRFKTETGSPWQMVLAGSDWHGAEVVHGLIRQSAFAADIRSLGFVADADLPTLYRAADLFVFPSLFEGFGLPPAEAMACGCPVLASARGGLGEVIGDAAAILDPESTIDIQAQLTRLAGDIRAREHLRAKGLSQAASFDWRRTAASTLEVYASAAAKMKRIPNPDAWVPSLRDFGSAPTVRSAPPSLES
jgi:glycosyltransferase involved in cell wall biosynthesis